MASGKQCYQIREEKLMPKGPAPQWRARKQPLTDEHVQASVAQGMNAEGHYGVLVYGPIDDPARALEIKRSLYRCAKFLGYAMHADIEQRTDGKHQVRFKAIDKAKARAHIAQKYKDRPHELPYNPYERTRKEPA
jgi:hypothetical protein